MYVISRLRWTTKGLEREVIAKTTKKRKGTEFLVNEQEKDPKGCYVMSYEKGEKNGK